MDPTVSLFLFLDHCSALLHNHLHWIGARRSCYLAKTSNATKKFLTLIAVATTALLHVAIAVRAHFFLVWRHQLISTVLH